MPFIQPDAEERLSQAGFSDYEINEFSQARSKNGVPITHNIDSQTWQAMINERASWVESLKNRGWTDEQIKREIQDYYTRRSGRSPFDFLKAEYRPIRRADYWDSQRNQKKVDIMSDVTGYFGTEISNPPITESSANEPDTESDEELDMLEEDIGDEDWMPDEDEMP